MSIQSKYASAVNSSNLMDDAFHDNCVPLGASGWAGRKLSELGSLLLRVHVADGMPSKIFESSTRNLAPVLTLWLPLVREKARQRKWLPEETPRQINTAEITYSRVALSSLAYFIDSRCNECQGATVDHDRRTCQRCKGTGIEELLMHQNEKDITLDLVSELRDIMQSHVRRMKENMRLSGDES